MNNKGKATILLILVLLVSVSLTGLIYYFLRQEHERVLALQTDLDKSKMEEKRTAEKLKAAEINITSLKDEIDSKKREIGVMMSKIEEANTARTQALSQLDKLQTDLKSAVENRKKLESQLTLSMDQMKQLEAKLKKMEEEKGVKVSEAVPAAAEKVELGKIVISPENNQKQEAVPGTLETKQSTDLQSSVSGGGQEGKILVVNRDYNFVIINLGSKDSVNVGDLFSVFHDNKYLGDVKVEKVHDFMSAAGFVNLEARDKVNESDRIARKI